MYGISCVALVFACLFAFVRLRALYRQLAKQHIPMISPENAGLRAAADSTDNEDGPKQRTSGSSGDADRPRETDTTKLTDIRIATTNETIRTKAATPFTLLPFSFARARAQSNVAISHVSPGAIHRRSRPPPAPVRHLVAPRIRCARRHLRRACRRLLHRHQPSMSRLAHPGLRPLSVVVLCAYQHNRIGAVNVGCALASEALDAPAASPVSQCRFNFF